MTVSLNGTESTFNPTDGSYVFGSDVDGSYQAAINNEIDNDAGDVQGIVLAKDWPVGEPPGIKIVNDDRAVKQEGRPTNCIMATSYREGHFLDSTDPQPDLCSGPFQSHKRFKLAMLPTSVNGGADAEEGIDLVFNVETEEGSRDYQVFQKINNWTNGRLDGFTIEVGTGIGADFVPANEGPAQASRTSASPFRRASTNPASSPPSPRVCSDRSTTSTSVGRASSTRTLAPGSTSPNTPRPGVRPTR